MKDTTKLFQGKTIAVSGGFDPVHVGHLDMFEHAKSLVGQAGTLMVFVNSDDFLVRKKGKPFIPLEERMKIISAFRAVDKVVAVIDTDQTVCETLQKYKPDIFANGGDRTRDNIPEDAVCQKCNITMIFNVGGDKTQSSSELLKKFSSE